MLMRLGGRRTGRRAGRWSVADSQSEEQTDLDGHCGLGLVTRLLFSDVSLGTYVP